MSQISNIPAVGAKRCRRPYRARRYSPASGALARARATTALPRLVFPSQLEAATATACPRRRQAETRSRQRRLRGRSLSSDRPFHRYERFGDQALARPGPGPWDRAARLFAALVSGISSPTNPSWPLRRRSGHAAHGSRRGPACPFPAARQRWARWLLPQGQSSPPRSPAGSSNSSRPKHREHLDLAPARPRHERNRWRVPGGTSLMRCDGLVALVPDWQQPSGSHKGETLPTGL
jgi:hypothetical protein